MRIFCLAVLLAAAGPLVAEDAPAKPGFWKRTWDGTKKGVGSVVGVTKKAGEKTIGAVTSPFRKSGRQEAPASSSWKKLEMTMNFEPPEVRLPSTRFLDVRVTVTNKGKETVQLEFPSSLRVDVLLKDDTGKVLSRWSDDQRIEREASVLVVNPGERLEYNARVSTRDMQAGRRFEIEASFPSYEKLRVSRGVSPVK